MLPPDFHVAPRAFGPMLPNGRNSRDPQSMYDAYRRKRNTQTAFANSTGGFVLDRKAGTQPNFLAAFNKSLLPVE